MNLKTKLHRYRFDLRTPEGRVAWINLKDQLEINGWPHCMESWGGKDSHYSTAIHIAQIALGNGNIETVDVELEVEHLFANQWNTAPIGEHKGFRVFDWALDYKFGNIGGDPQVKTGYYLEQTDEMRRLRAETLHCGYCGKQVLASKQPADGFCDKCLDSEYLKESDLKLLRLRPINEDTPHNSRHELSDEEKAELLPRYQHAQLHGVTERGKARLVRVAADIEDKYAKTIKNATVERDGNRWLLRTAPNLIGNAIYYTHTGRWSIGWNKKIDDSLLPEVKRVMRGFPFPFDIETPAGKITL